MRRIARKLFVGVCLSATVVTLGVAGFEMLIFAQQGHFPWMNKRGFMPAVATELPYRWPNEVWESPGVLGFHRGVLFIGGVEADKGYFLERDQYVIIPYWFCGVIVLLGIAGIISLIPRRKRVP